MGKQWKRTLVVLDEPKECVTDEGKVYSVRVRMLRSRLFAWLYTKLFVKNKTIWEA